MTATHLQPNLKVASLLCVIGVGLLFAPSAVTDRIRVGVRDATVPGLWATRALAAQCRTARYWIQQFHATTNRSDALKARSQAWRQLTRKLEVENAYLRERLAESKRQSAFGRLTKTDQRLAIPQLIQAAVVGEETSTLWQAGQILNCGLEDGVHGSELVFEPSKLLIDQGSTSGVGLEQPAYAGLCVVGRVVRVGQWTSTVQLTTDPEYRSYVQLARRTPDGIVLGAEGILKGCGDGTCRIEAISSTEPVREGDLVLSGKRDGVTAFPMYFGTIVSAALTTGAPHWKLRMRPQIDATKLRQVQVMQHVLNPVRVARK